MRKKHKQNGLLSVLAVTFVLVSTIPDSAALVETTFGLQAKSVSLPRKNAYGDTLYALRPGGPQSAPKDVKLELPAHMSVTNPPTNQPGWPIYTENWHYPGIGLYAEVDRNYPGLEVVIAVYGCRPMHFDWTRLYVRHQDGTPVSGFDPYLYIEQPGTKPAVADLEGDGPVEIILTTNQESEPGGMPPMIFVFDDTGAIKPGWPDTLTTSAVGADASMPVIADLNGDGINEIIVYSGGGDGNKLHVFNPDGSYYKPWVWPISGVLGTPAVANLDDDPELEIVIPAYYSTLLALNEDGTTLWEETVDPTYTVLTPSIGDIDRDGELEIVVGTGRAAHPGKIYVFESDGYLSDIWPQEVAGAFPYNVVIADIDIHYDGLELITAPGIHVTSIFALHADGTPVSGWPVNTGTNLDNSPAVCDLNADGQMEVLITTGHDEPDPRLFIIEPDGSYFCEPIDVLSRAASPAVGDIDDDGIIEIIQPGGGDYINVFEFTQFPGGRIVWPMMGANAAHTGLYADHFMRGDVNRDGRITISDVVYLINYLFGGGSAPDPLELGDANCDGLVDITDVVYLVNYLFIGGPAPPC